MSHPELIVALDVEEINQANALINQFSPNYCALKIGSEFFTNNGPDFVKECIKKGFRIFLDLKFHDIPTTVARAVKAAANLGVWMVNIHACGGMAMMVAAREALLPFGSQRPLLIGVTVLTSHDAHTLESIGITENLSDQVIRLASLADKAQLDGVVCSAQEVEQIKATISKNFITVTPGIRLANEDKHDQIRTLSPLEAKQKGADYLVVGRLLTQHPNPRMRLEELYWELRCE